MILQNVLTKLHVLAIEFELRQLHMRVVIFADKSSYAEFGKGTRKWMLERVQKWFDDKQTDERAFWLRGGAGLGKSVMAGMK